MNALRTLVLVATVGCAASAALAQTPVGAEPALAVGEYMKAEQSGGLGQNKRVAISSFVIQFVRDQGIERDAGSFGMFQAQKDKHMAVNVLVTAKGLPLVTYGVIDKKWLPGQASGIGSMQALVLGSATAAKALQAPILNVRLTVSMVEQKGKGWGSSAQFGNLVHKTASWQFDGDPMPRFVEDATALMVHGVNLSGLPSSRNVLSLVKPVPITGLQLSAEKGDGAGSARGSGLLGAIGRAAGGTDKAADAYLDIDPANFTSRVTDGGTRVLELFAKALTAR
jgi:hypothetical protein